MPSRFEGIFNNRNGVNYLRKNDLNKYVNFENLETSCQRISMPIRIQRKLTYGLFIIEE